MPQSNSGYPLSTKPRLIDEWLSEHARQRGYLKLEVPEDEAEGEALIILHFFDQNDAFSFVLTFRGRSLD